MRFKALKLKERLNYMIRKIRTLAALVLPFCFQLNVVGQTIFSDDFSQPDGTQLNGTTPDIGGNWSVTSGSSSGIVINSGIVTTTGSNSPSSIDLMFANFTSTLGSNELLTMNFDVSGFTGSNVASGFAGISLFEGNNERFFIGSTSGSGNWGIAGLASTSVNVGANSGSFTYEYNTGAWTLSITGDSISGTSTANYGLDRIRIASDRSNIADIAVSSVEVSVVPEPSAYALIGGLIALGLIPLRRKK